MHWPHVAPLQSIPFVERAQERDSVLAEAVHMLLTHANVMVGRVSVPLNAHGFPGGGVHAENGPVGIGAGQSVSATQSPRHASAISLHVPATAHGLPACIVHAPSTQVSAPLQYIPSSQLPVVGVFMQPVG
jgi:hypothetical protein